MSLPNVINGTSVAQSIRFHSLYDEHVWRQGSICPRSVLHWHHHAVLVAVEAWVESRMMLDLGSIVVVVVSTSLYRLRQRLLK